MDNQQRYHILTINFRNLNNWGYHRTELSYEDGIWPTVLTINCQINQRIDLSQYLSKKSLLTEETMTKHFISTASWINACNFCLINSLDTKQIFILLVNQGVQPFVDLSDVLFHIKAIKTCVFFLKHEYN